MLLTTYLNLLILFVALFVNVIIGAYMDVGENCQPRQDPTENGECMLITDCKEAIRYIRQKDKHPFLRCGFEKSMEVVCCPKNTTKPMTTSGPRYGTKDMRVVEKYCKKIVADSIPPLDLHIIGGENAQLGEFPHMAALGFLRENVYKFDCGGTLISEYYILTAAHCVDNIEQIKPSIARLGVVEIGQDQFNPDTDIKINTITSHPSRSNLYKYHDIALLRLEKPPQFAINLYPACLYTEETMPKVPLTITGWGKISVEKDLRGKVLQKANVSYVASSECGQNFLNWRKLPDGISEGQFCAGDPNGRTDACQGDSGGPIQALTARDGYYRILGVTSFGRGCGSPVPGVYTRLYPYLDWIESVVWPNGA